MAEITSSTPCPCCKFKISDVPINHKRSDSDYLVSVGLMTLK
ncbi:hypothetical protein SAMN06273570_4246 [Candidatus Pantoea floridensis]|uniref:Uncharacterized protein n=1 Tax=Candidatus Pantoea floridensis TaxID=1938870 RepID=A0A286DL37_9GAMM|nr:hypothetical protein BX596_3969 [Enterobacteriaceae bacterium JKS000233]SOD59346.1 hypothetical protein SAMN06273570_4246 [Pantoea floridensis]